MQLSCQMLFSEGVGYGQGLPSQREGDRIVVRCVDAAVNLARTRLQWPANERPINMSVTFDRHVMTSDIRAPFLRSSIRPDHMRSCSRTIRSTCLANSRNDRGMPMWYMGCHRRNEYLALGASFGCEALACSSSRIKGTVIVSKDGWATSLCVIVEG